MDLALSPARRIPAALLAALAAALGIAAFAAPAAAAYGHSSGDRVVFGSSVVIPVGDEVKGDLVVMAGSAEVHGTVDGDAVVMAGSLYVAPEGVVKGDTVALGGSVDNESTVKHSGSSSVAPMPTMAPTPPDESNNSDTTYTNSDNFDGRRVWVTVLVVFGICTLLAFVFFPNRTKMTLDHLLNKPALAGVLGFTWPFTLSIVCVGLAITVLGIVLIPVAVIAIGLGYLVGRAAIAMFLGQRFFEYSKVVEPNPLATLALGLAIITVLEGIAPIWVGIVLESCLSALAIGAATLTLLNKQNWPQLHGSLPPPPPGTYSGPMPQPVFAPPTPPPPPGPPAIPQ